MSLRHASSGVSYVFLKVEQLDVMVDWYVRAMGLEVYFSNSECAFLRSQAGAGAALALYSRSIETDLPLLAVDVSDLEAASAGLRELDAESPTIQPVPGGRAIRLTDPEGNQVELHEREH